VVLADQRELVSGRSPLGNVLNLSTIFCRVGSSVRGRDAVIYWLIAGEASLLILRHQEHKKSKERDGETYRTECILPRPWKEMGEWPT
jgi:hypothetical protein